MSACRQLWPAFWCAGATLLGAALELLLGVRGAAGWSVAATAFAFVGLGLAPVARWSADGFSLDYLTPSLLTMLALVAGRSSAVAGAGLVVLVGGWTTFAVVANVCATRSAAGLPWDPEDILAGAKLAAIAGHLLLGTLLSLALLVAVGSALVAALLVRRARSVWSVAVASLAALLPTAAARRERWLLGGPGSSAQRPVFEAVARATAVLPVSLTPRLASRRWRCRAVLDRAYGISTSGELSAWRVETAYQGGCRALTLGPLDRSAWIEAYGELADLAFRAGRYADTVGFAARLAALVAVNYPTRATMRLVTHVALLRTMALARLGRTAAAEAALLVVGDHLAGDPDRKLLWSLAEGAVRLAGGETRDIVNRFRRSLTWADHEVDLATAWWRTFAQVLAAEAALASGDRQTAETYLVGTGLGHAPTCPQAALVLARARLEGGDQAGAAAALDHLLAHATAGPLAADAEARLANIRPRDVP